MASKPTYILLDTNVLISAIIFGGQPEVILRLVIDRKSKAVTSPILLAELSDVLIKKFNFTAKDLKLLRYKTIALFKLVHPTKHLTLLKDTADNRVLEAAIEGRCQYIITGDKELLELKKYKSVLIITPKQYLNTLK